MKNNNTDDINKYIAEEREKVPKHSFVDNRQEAIKECPPPKYLPESILFEYLPTKKEEIMQGFQFDKQTGSLICVDQEAMDR